MGRMSFKAPYKKQNPFVFARAFLLRRRYVNTPVTLLILADYSNQRDDGSFKPG